MISLLLEPPNAAAGAADLPLAVPLMAASPFCFFCGLPPLLLPPDRGRAFRCLSQVPYVKRVIEEADGIQPHLVAPEAGYRRLLEEALGYLKDPCDKSVEEVRPWGGIPLKWRGVGARGGWIGLGVLAWHGREP